ncbi:hypothetical protein FRUB_09065 [Fimbriiglobus ruber]|uniref:Uncharacterized protein n=2 Tax=Fimbriiglobus ruber TaxID=1908690 RepID=A0A225D4S9_9BACT|nr:hypothetical protein FRUB_09065 [Fimbriiglobus ruber]
MVTNSELIKTVIVQSSDWKATTLHNLSQVEDLLDSLEMHGIADREVVALGNSTFIVRWK